MMQTKTQCKMRYCGKCGGKHYADVEIKSTTYPNGDGYINIKTLFCPCSYEMSILQIQSSLFNQ